MLRARRKTRGAGRGLDHSFILCHSFRQHTNTLGGDSMMASTHTFRRTLLALAFLTTGVAGPAIADEEAATTLYNEKLALEVGADDYGMRQYVLAFLRAGPNRERTAEEATALQRAHLDNIKRLADMGKLVLAGPFLDGGELRGLYLFDVKTIEEAEELTRTDPAIMAGSLVMELHPWYGSAAIMKIPAIHDTIKKSNP